MGLVRLVVNNWARQTAAKRAADLHALMNDPAFVRMASDVLEVLPIGIATPLAEAMAAIEHWKP